MFVFHIFDHSLELDIKKINCTLNSLSFITLGAEAMFADLGHFSVKSIQVNPLPFCVFLHDILYISIII
jgi:K+ transporter